MGETLGIMGEYGVQHVMESLLADLDIMMNVAGCQSVQDIDRGWLESQPKRCSLDEAKSKL